MGKNIGQAYYPGEAEALGRYLIGLTPDENSRKLYMKLVSHQAGELTDKESTAFKTMLDKRLLIGLIDSGLAIVNPSSEIRRRLYIMFGVLESSPNYYEYFLPKKRNPIYVIVVAFTGLWSIIKMLLGAMIVKAKFRL